MTAKVTITLEFSTVEEATDFMGARHLTTKVSPMVAFQIPENAAPKYSVAQSTIVVPEPVPPTVTTVTPPMAPDAAGVLTMPTAQPTSKPAAPKEPNKPVQSFADAIKTPLTLHPATQDGVRAALKEVFNARGATAATQILKGHGAVSVSTVDKSRYADFVKACATA